MDTNETLYRELYRIRRFEETVLENFQKGVFHGTTHTSIGQEANAVGVLSHISPDDVVFSNHRCHGHYLAYGGDMHALFAELMGKESGVCSGRGGSQHLYWRNFYSHGIQGGIVPIATGMSFAERFFRKGTIAICFLGDGTLGEGVVYESLNIASLWRLPILYVLENNKIAQTTPIDQAVAGSVPRRFEAFGIETVEIDSIDVLEIRNVARSCISKVREECIPQALILNTERLGPHSKGDDTRGEDLLTILRNDKDPLIIQGERLVRKSVRKIESEVDQEVKEAYDQAIADPPSIKLNEECFVDSKVEVVEIQDSNHEKRFQANAIKKRTVLADLNDALHVVMKLDDRVFILGEDILDPYGGAFKMTQGLSSAFSNRVKTTPISEAAIVGVATGMAMRGLHPVVEIMFGDFLTLAAHQIINHLTKFHWIFNGKVELPMLIRTPMGGRRGYGSAHSQTLEKLFLGVPGLLVLAVSDIGTPKEVLLKALYEKNPVLFIENKLQYSLPVISEGALKEFSVSKGFTQRGYPYYVLSIAGTSREDLTLVTYGYMAKYARDAALKLAYQHEIFVNLMVQTQLSPFELDPVIEAITKTRKILTIEEGTRTLGWGTEVIAQVSEAFGSKPIQTKRIGAKDVPIPAAISLEHLVLPDVEDIVKAALEMTRNGFT